MHEMALMEGMIQIIEEEALRQGFSKVLGVVLEIGALSGVEPQALRFAFEVVTEGTPAAGAALDIEAVPGSGLCLACGGTSVMDTRLAACAHCGDVPLQVLAGTEMRVKALDVD